MKCQLISEKGDRKRKSIKEMSADDVVAEHLTTSKCPACWSKKVAVWAPLVGPFNEVNIEGMSCRQHPDC